MLVLAACSAGTEVIDPGELPKEPRIVAEDFGLGAVLLGSEKTVRLELPGVDPTAIVPVDFAALGCEDVFCTLGREGGGIDIRFRPPSAGRFAADLEVTIAGARHTIRLDG